MTKFRTEIAVINTHRMNSEEGRSVWAGEVQEIYLEELQLELAHEGWKDVNREGEEPVLGYVHMP